LLFDFILLVHFRHINGERSEAAIYHILKGKQSIQTVQDIHIFHLDKFYGAARFLNRDQFYKRIEKLRRDGKLQKQKINDHYAVTQLGKSWLEKNLAKLPINYFNGYKYDRITDVFYDRLLLLIQSLTNSRMGNLSFIPVISNRSAELWVKKFYARTRDSRQDVLSVLYKELLQLLSSCSQLEAEIFVDRLTGYRKYGLSIDQLASEYEREKEDINLMLTGIIHHFLSMAENKPAQFPLMTHLIKDVRNTSKLSHSASITRDFLDKEHSISYIARRRDLKENTIYDHIVEIAYMDDQFPVTNYVSKNKQDTIIRTIRQAETHRLREIKELLGDDFSYFEIRLVLAAYNNLLKMR